MAQASFPEAILHPGIAIRRGVALPPRAEAPVRAVTTGGLVLRCLMAGLTWLAGGVLLLVGLAGAYTLKRALDIDIVPGVDMLPDPEIEAAIHAVLAMLGLA